MAKYSDDLYFDAISTTVGDVYYSNASFSTRISRMRRLAEYYVRRLIKLDSNSMLLLGDPRTKKQLKAAGVTEDFFWNSFKIVHRDGRNESHSQKYKLPTEEDFNTVSKAIVTIQAYLFFDYFKKYKFGSNKEVETYFSLLPPFFRLEVLKELLFQDFENMEVVEKFGLVAIKHLGKDGASKLIEEEKEHLNEHLIPISSVEAKQMLEIGGIEAYTQFLRIMSGSIYNYLTNMVRDYGDSFEIMPKRYTTFEEAKKYYLNEQRLEGNSQDIVEFNALMEYIYAGR